MVDREVGGAGVYLRSLIRTTLNYSRDGGATFRYPWAPSTTKMYIDIL